MTGKSSYMLAPGVGIPQNYDMIDFIQSKISVFFNIPKNRLCSDVKKRETSFPRQLSIVLSKKYTGLSQDVIALRHGGKDRTLVVYSEKTIRAHAQVGFFSSSMSGILEAFISDTSNNIMYNILIEIGKEFPASMYEVMNLRERGDESYEATCVAIWILQSLKKKSVIALAKTFNTSPAHIKQALIDRVTYCSNDHLFFEKAMRARNSVVNIFI